jgi:Phosphotransferase enzyme family
MSWIPEPSQPAVAEALRPLAPELSGLLVAVPDLTNGGDPVFWSTSVALGEDFFVKFAWSEPAAHFVLHQITVLEALAREPAVPFLPEVIAAGTDPAILVTRRVRGASLFAAGAVPAWYPLVTTGALRERLGRWVTSDQQEQVAGWCDWTDETLADPRPLVLVHGDLHGDNQVWDGGELKAVLDFANVGAGEPEYELRAFPGPGMGPGLELVSAVTRHYERMTGRELSTERIMAWHIRQALGDVLWRSEAGLPLPDHRAPGDWVADIAARFCSLGGIRLRRGAGCLGDPRQQIGE